MIITRTAWLLGCADVMSKLVVLCLRPQELGGNDHMIEIKFSDSYPER